MPACVHGLFTVDIGHAVVVCTAHNAPFCLGLFSHFCDRRLMSCSAFTGAPSSPVPVPVFNSPGEVTLEWDVPFSWPEYPVQSYDVVASNRSALNRDDINETRVLFVARPGDNQGECEAIEFKVRASSDLGDSEYGSVIAGFPIGMYMYVCIMHVVTNGIIITSFHFQQTLRSNYYAVAANSISNYYGTVRSFA